MISFQSVIAGFMVNAHLKWERKFVPVMKIMFLKTAFAWVSNFYRFLQGNSKCTRKSWTLYAVRIVFYVNKCVWSETICTSYLKKASKVFKKL